MIHSRKNTCVWAKEVNVCTKFLLNSTLQLTSSFWWWWWWWWWWWCDASSECIIWVTENMQPPKHGDFHPKKESIWLVLFSKDPAVFLRTPAAIWGIISPMTHRETHRGSKVADGEVQPKKKLLRKRNAEDFQVVKWLCLLEPVTNPEFGDVRGICCMLCGLCQQRLGVWWAMTGWGRFLLERKDRNPGFEPPTLLNPLGPSPNRWWYPPPQLFMSVAR